MALDTSITETGREAVMAQAARVLVARLAASEDAIAVALDIARGENHVPEARAAALRSIARLMDSSATIATALARMNGTTHDQHIIVERIGERVDEHGGGDKSGPLSTPEAAEKLEKRKRNPGGGGGPKKFSARDPGEPSPHLWPPPVRRF